MSTAPQPSFNWWIHEESLCPPKGRPKAPFVPTSIEIMRSCALRSCFKCSKGYEHRTAYSARVGIAFHRALQSLTEYAIIASNKNEVIYEAARRFYHELTLQEVQKAVHLREQMLVRNEERIRR